MPTGKAWKPSPMIIADNTPDKAPDGERGALSCWPEAAARDLLAIAQANAHSGAFAVFDMDNTSYRHDLTEALLPFLEMRGLLTRETMDPSLRLIPFRDEDGQRESLYSYYWRLSEIDEKVYYSWIAQIFSGLSLRVLKQQVDDLMALDRPVPAMRHDGTGFVAVEVPPPRIFRGMVQLYNCLHRHGIAVYVITAAHEEIVRMVAADPKYGYNVRPENVIGVTTLLRDPATGGFTTARKMIAEQSYDWESTLDHVLHPFLWSPATWMEGKHAAILGYIDPVRKAVLVGGDTPISDGYMLLNGVDTERGGRLWINRRDDYMAELRRDWINGPAHRQRELGRPVTADRNWIVVGPDDIE